MRNPSRLPGITLVLFSVVSLACAWTLPARRPRKEESSVYLQKAKTSFEEGDFKGSVGYALQILALPALDGNHRLEAKHVMDRSLERLGWKGSATELFEVDIYLDEGVDYLAAGEFDRAYESFSAAKVLDPSNQLALDGLESAESKRTTINGVDPRTLRKGGKP